MFIYCALDSFPILQDNSNKAIGCINKCSVDTIKWDRSIFGRSAQLNKTFQLKHT